MKDLLTAEIQASTARLWIVHYGFLLFLKECREILANFYSFRKKMLLFCLSPCSALHLCFALPTSLARQSKGAGQESEGGQSSLFIFFSFSPFGLHPALLFPKGEACASPAQAPLACAGLGRRGWEVVASRLFIWGCLQI